MEEHSYCTRPSYLQRGGGGGGRGRRRRLRRRLWFVVVEFLVE